MKITTDVLIAGAAPVGLLLATEQPGNTSAVGELLGGTSRCTPPFAAGDRGPDAVQLRRPMSAIRSVATNGSGAGGMF